MTYLVMLPILFVSIILYLVGSNWEFKLLKLIAKVLIYISSIFFVITYASYLGYKIPVVTNLVEDLIDMIKIF